MHMHMYMYAKGGRRSRRLDPLAVTRSARYNGYGQTPPLPHLKPNDNQNANQWSHEHVIIYPAHCEDAIQGGGPEPLQSDRHVAPARGREAYTPCTRGISYQDTDSTRKSYREHTLETNITLTKHT